MNVKQLLFAAILLIAAGLVAQDTRFEPQGEQIPGPDNARDSGDQCCYRSDEVKDPQRAFREWIEDVRHWRRERLIRIGYVGSQYARPELAWTQSSFIQPQMMIEDRYFFDPVTGKYTVDRYLDDLGKRYGGIDSVLIWHTFLHRPAGSAPAGSYLAAGTTTTQSTAPAESCGSGRIY